MTATRVVMAAAALALATVAGAAEDAKKTEKPIVGCDQIMEVYKVNHSVDETSSRLYVDQSRVAECVKKAGVAMPQQENR